MTNDRLRIGITVLVTVIWTVASVVGIVTQNYTELGIVTPVMMLVGGFLFAFRREER